MGVVSLIDGRGHRIRHIHPTAFRASEGATATVLGRTYGFTWLPSSGAPTSDDLVEGSYSGRLGDSGEFSLTFPNAVGTKGQWRTLFDPDKALQFVEIYRDDHLEFVGSITRMEIDRGKVTISGSDAWSLLRRAYERDRSWTAAPQEVMQAYTRVPVAVIADDHTTLNWNAETGSRSVSNGQLVITGTGAGVSEVSRSVSISSDFWRMTCKVDRFTTTTGTSSFRVTLRSAGDLQSDFTFGDAFAVTTPRPMRLEAVSSGSVQSLIDGLSYFHEIGPATVTVERQGRWLGGYVNGKLIGFIGYSGFGSPYEFKIRAGSDGSGTHTVYIDSFEFTEYQPFLARGSDLGSYVLPGSYPHGGLRGRYFSDADLQGLSTAARYPRIMSPNRVTDAPERLDPVIDTSGGLSLPGPIGGSGDYFSVRWFGAVYLRGDLGNYTFETTTVTDGVRLWVGKTAWGDQLIDDWVAASGTSTGTWTAANFGSAAGWYPVVLEYFCDTAAPVIRLQFTPPGSTYTDPGGTSITASTKRVIPLTSLSPLGCFDNRVQGSSHFDMVQSVGAQFGYQLWCEPMQLESGEFPGRLVPRLRVGRDTDVVMEVEDSDGAEPLLSPGTTIDASEQSLALIGAGSGIADGAGSQVTANLADLTNLASGLFALTSWVDAGDIAFRDLLEARLNAELALRASPWEEVRGTPRGQERLADTWPLSSVLSAMRWRPGDGVRLLLPDIGVEDATPRQMLQVTRSFGAEGRTGTQVAFRQRPRSAARSMRGLLRSAIAPSRAYQGQKVTLPSSYVTGTILAAGFSTYAIVPLLPGDKVVKATLRIVRNSTDMAIGAEINTVSRTTALGGTWSTLPIEVDITAYATQWTAADGRLFVRLQNTGVADSFVEFQFFVEVLR